MSHNLDDLLKQIKNKPGSESKDALPKSPSRKVEILDEGKFHQNTITNNEPNQEISFHLKCRRK